MLRPLNHLSNFDFLDLLQYFDQKQNGGVKYGKNFFCQAKSLLNKTAQCKKLENGHVKAT